MQLKGLIHSMSSVFEKETVRRVSALRSFTHRHRLIAMDAAGERHDGKDGRYVAAHHLAILLQ